LLESPAELLPALGLAPLEDTSPKRPAHPLLEHLVGETLTADELAERAARPVAEVLVALVELELNGAVTRKPGGLFSLRP
jgi:predicted Rossmann fold nucleotide-binding protein DprA/Smf involved in DNA uptake